MTFPLLGHAWDEDAVREGTGSKAATRSCSAIGGVGGNAAAAGRIGGVGGGHILTER